MQKNLVRARFLIIPALFVVCFLFIAPVHAQDKDAFDEIQMLYVKFRAEIKLPCGQRAEAILTGRELVSKLGLVSILGEEVHFRNLVEYVKKRLSVIIPEEIKCNAELSLPNLYDNFKSAIKVACGQRDAALSVGKLILTLHADDALNDEVIDFVKMRLEVIEKEDPVCRRHQAYNAAFNAKNWEQVFATGKIIIDAEGDKPKALDVMLDLAQVGYDRTAYGEDDSFNVETVNYAIKALELIEKGVKTQSCWGAFNCFKDREKTLGWLNYIVGYVSYFRLKGGKKAIPFFYAATLYQMEFKYDAFIYQAVAKYYFDRQASMTSGTGINTFINRAQSLINPVGDAANGFTETPEDAEITALYRQLVKLYDMRYNLEANENVPDLGKYIQILIDRPLLEPSKNKGKSSR